MLIKADWALFQSTEYYGYAMIAGTLSATHLKTEIARLSDVPSGSDGRVLPLYAWLGCRVGDSYVFALSTPDAAGRAGGYISRVLALPLDEAALMPTLDPVFKILRDRRVFETPGQAAVGVDVPDASVTLHRPEVGELLTAYSQRATGRAVLLDSPDTPEILSGLWSTLWPSARASFSFKSYFDPNQLAPDADVPPLLVITPTPAPRWTARHFPTVPGEHADPPAPLIAHLLGTPDPVAAQYLQEYTGSLRDLPALSVLHADLVLARTAHEVMPVVYALDTLRAVALDAAVRNRLQHSLFKTLVHITESSRGRQILALSRLADPDVAVLQAVERWAEYSLLFDEDATVVFSHDQPGWLGRSITAGLRRVSPDARTASLIWQHWALLNGSGHLELFLVHSWDHVLAQTLPTEPPVTAETRSKNHGLWEVYVQLTSRQTPAAGLRGVLADTEGEVQASVLGQLISIWGGAEFLDAAAELNEPRLDEAALELIQTQSHLFQGILPERAAWRRWWDAQVEAGRGVWEHIPHPGVILERLLALSPACWPTTVLQAIAQTSEASLLGLDPIIRAPLWGVLPSGFIRHTAAAWLAETRDPGETEDALLDQVIRALGDRVSPQVALRTLRQRGTTLPADKLDVVMQSLKPLAVPQDIEALLLQRVQQEPQIGHQLFDHTVTGRYGLSMQFFTPFFPLLRSMQKVRYLNALNEPLSEELWWQAVRELAVRSFGDSLDVVWADIGGSAKHLRDGLSREDRWYYALDRIRTKGRPWVGDLLSEIGRIARISNDTTVLWETRPPDLIGDRHRK